MKFGDEKIETLRNYILQECKAQGFSVRDFDILVMELSDDLNARKEKTYDEPF